MATARKRTTVSNKGRVPGSGKNYAKGKGSIERFIGGKARVFGNRSNPKYKGVEGPKKSMPRPGAKKSGSNLKDYRPKSSPRKKK